MIFPKTDVLEQIRLKYPKGQRVRLVRMADAYAPPMGTLGTVDHVDSAGTVHVHWDSGSSLGVVYLEDYCEVI